MDDVEVGPQDAPVRELPQGRAAPQDAASNRSALTPGWYPSPDGSRTLSWWTGRHWSRTVPRKPLQRNPIQSRVPLGRRCRRRNLPVALGLSLLGGPLGAVYANWRIGGPMAAVTWLAVANSMEPYASFTYALLLPVNAALAAHLAARHNERVDNQEALQYARRSLWRPADRPMAATEFARFG